LTRWLPEISAGKQQSVVYTFDPMADTATFFTAKGYSWHFNYTSYCVNNIDNFKPITEKSLNRFANVKKDINQNL